MKTEVTQNKTKVKVTIENDYNSQHSHDSWIEEISEFVNNQDTSPIVAVTQNNRLNNVIEDAKNYNTDIATLNKCFTVIAKGYSQAEWQETKVWHKEGLTKKDIEYLTNLLQRQFTHKNDYWISKSDVITQDGRKYESEVYDCTPLTIDYIEFPEEKDIIKAYNESYGIDYDILEVNVD